MPETGADGGGDRPPPLQARGPDPASPDAAEDLAMKSPAHEAILDPTTPALQGRGLNPTTPPPSGRGLDPTTPPLQGRGKGWGRATDAAAPSPPSRTSQRRPLVPKRSPVARPEQEGAQRKPRTESPRPTLSRTGHKTTPFREAARPATADAPRRRPGGGGANASAAASTRIAAARRLRRHAADTRF